MNKKIKTSIIKIVSLEDQILDIYREIIKKEIYNEDITNEIEKIKELKTQENFLNNLTYQELTEILNYIDSNNPFQIRIGIVLLLDFYINDKYIDKIFDIVDNIHNDNYYVRMANAWTLSICYIKYKEKTYNYLLNNNLDKFTFNKTISKICDSKRVDIKDKEKLKKIRR